MLCKLNFKIKVTIYLYKTPRKVRQNRKTTKRKVKETIKRKKKENKFVTLQSRLFF